MVHVLKQSAGKATPPIFSRLECDGMYTIRDTSGIAFSKESSMEEESVVKTRSFRDEGYSNRRVFLRSYPLQWEEGEEEAEEEQERKAEAEEVSRLVSLKNRFIAVFQWREGKKFLLLKRFKDKVAFYLVACQPFGFRSSNKLITI